MKFCPAFFKQILRHEFFHRIIIYSKTGAGGTLLGSTCIILHPTSPLNVFNTAGYANYACPCFGFLPILMQMGDFKKNEDFV